MKKRQTVVSNNNRKVNRSYQTKHSRKCGRRGNALKKTYIRSSRLKEKGEESLSTLRNFIVYLNQSCRQPCNYVRYLFHNLKQVLGLFYVVGFCSSLLSYYCHSSMYANKGIHHEICVVLQLIVDAFRTTRTTPLDPISVRNRRCCFEDKGNTMCYP